MEQVILFAPLLGAVVCAFSWRLIGETAAGWTATGLMFFASFLSWILLLNFDPAAHESGRYTVALLRWIESGSLTADWAIRIDRLAVLMLATVTTVSALIHLYGLGGLDPDEPADGRHARLFMALSLATFAMSMFVVSDNLAQLVFGWQGVAFAAYLLITNNRTRPAAKAAALKSFVVNRFGDAALLLAVFALFLLADSLSFDDIFASAPTLADDGLRFLGSSWSALELVCVLFLLAAIVKSAQFLFHVWLPDTVEGPAAGVAFIQSLSVAAGILLICRMSPVFEFAAWAQGAALWIGVVTALFGASVALAQTDIRRIVAYSVCAQLGVMFVALGLGAYSVAVLHLIALAFFAALLVLGTGSVMRAMEGEKDVSKLGGLRGALPVTFWAMVVGALSLAGIGIPFTKIGLSGFASRDVILAGAFVDSPVAFWAMVLAVFLASLAIWRLIFLTFFGEGRGNPETRERAGESPWVMTVPLGLLSVGAIVIVTAFYQPLAGSQPMVDSYFGLVAVEEDADDAASQDGREPGQGALYIAPENTVLEDAQTVPPWAKLSPLIATLLGLVVAFLLYVGRPEVPHSLAESQSGLHDFLRRGWKVDALYEALFVTPAKAAGTFFWRTIDGAAIDGGVNGLATGVVPALARLAGRAQTGYIFTYAAAMVLGIFVLVAWVFVSGG